MVNWNSRASRKSSNGRKKTAKERLESICNNYLEGCPLYIKHVAIGDPAQEILRLIESEQIDTVVMATKGEKSNFGFGSVTEKIVKNSPVPVVSIPVSDTGADAQAAESGNGA
jgi:nucleotide-binding universal stress UspA family protein